MTTIIDMCSEIIFIENIVAQIVHNDIKKSKIEIHRLLSRINEFIELSKLL